MHIFLLFSYLHELNLKVQVFAAAGALFSLMPAAALYLSIVDKKNVT
jgi:hypothetical protein